jgi:hypothetical protein
MKTGAPSIVTIHIHSTICVRRVSQCKYAVACVVNARVNDGPSFALAKRTPGTVAGGARETGEQVEVLEGTVTAVKNYPSTYSTPDDLAAGEMSMVNKSIDLQEKEKMNEKEFAALREGFRSVN